MEAPRFIARCRAGSIRLLSTTSIIECYIFNRDEKRREKESRGGSKRRSSRGKFETNEFVQTILFYQIENIKEEFDSSFRLSFHAI